MGNALARISSRHIVDGGQDREIAKRSTSVIPPTKTYNEKAVSKLIQERRLAPFYPDDPQTLIKSIESLSRRPFRLRRSKKTSSPVSKDWLTTDMVECPICFSSYPKNINKTCCCNQPICTLCFVNLRMHSNRRICCPYCNQVSLGVIYDSPQMIMMKERGGSGACSNLAEQRLDHSQAGIHNQEASNSSANFYYVRRSTAVGDTATSQQSSSVQGQNRQRQSNYNNRSNPYRPPAPSSQSNSASHPSHRTYYYQYSLFPFQ